MRYFKSIITELEGGEALESVLMKETATASIDELIEASARFGEELFIKAVKAQQILIEEDSETLLERCLSSDIKYVSFYLNAGNKVTQKCLYKAIESGNNDLVVLLIKHGLPLDGRATELAVETLNVRLFFTCLKAKLPPPNLVGYLISRAKDEPLIVKQILEIYHKFNHIFSFIDMATAIRNDNIDIVRQLNDYGVGFETYHLKLACEEGNLSIVKFLLDHNVTPSIDCLLFEKMISNEFIQNEIISKIHKTKRCVKPTQLDLEKSIRLGQDYIAELCVNLGVSLRDNDYFDNYLEAAISSKSEKWINLILLENNSTTIKKDKTLALRALELGSSLLYLKLIEQGCSVDDSDRSTLLGIKEFRFGHKKILKSLFKEFQFNKDDILCLFGKLDINTLGELVEKCSLELDSEHLTQAIKQNNEALVDYCLKYGLCFTNEDLNQAVLVLNPTLVLACLADGVNLDWKKLFTEIFPRIDDYVVYNLLKKTELAREQSLLRHACLFNKKHVIDLCLCSGCRFDGACLSMSMQGGNLELIGVILNEGVIPGDSDFVIAGSTKNNEVVSFLSNRGFYPSGSVRELLFRCFDIKIDNALDKPKAS